jgi:hypothetical protein
MAVFPKALIVGASLKMGDEDWGECDLELMVDMDGDLNMAMPSALADDAKLCISLSDLSDAMNLLGFELSKRTVEHDDDDF